ncbi:hypothetical protein HAX54_028440 [Datura stramonium]|uniref:Reverse transcriptase n=1 Tax=Datura stramonium TaxID=4076 RepID=A0ABS8V6Z3_DATST|nr:hypothetical protein [Datura stramonium]
MVVLRKPNEISFRLEGIANYLGLVVSPVDHEAKVLAAKDCVDDGTTSSKDEFFIDVGSGDYPNCSCLILVFNPSIISRIWLLKLLTRAREKPAPPNDP